MARKTPLEAWQTAIMIVRAFRALQEKKPRGVSRVKLSRRSLAALSARTILRDTFVDDVRLELANRGFTLLDRLDGFALIDSSSVQNWDTLSANLVRHDLDQAREGVFDFEAADEVFADAETAEDESDVA
jgi:hypothetical protein